MRRTGAVLALVVLALSLPTASAAAFGGIGQQSVDADVVVMTADVGADGDANWTIAYRIRLADENDTQAFESLQADIRENTSTYTGQFHDRMNRTARAGENATGREMTIENVSVETSQERFGQEYGVVRYRFAWTNFAAVEDDQIRVGDAISGLFLDSETSLTVSWPDGYQSQSVTPEPDEQSATSATWRGQQSFGNDEPRVTLASGNAPPTGDQLSVSPLVIAGVLALVLLLAGGGAYVLFRSDFFEDSAEESDAAASPAADSDDGAAASATPPADLLSNEEQVLQLLEENGGRMKQQRVAGELDWTDAKTSQVIGGLREDDDVETFRIGRENVVTLPDTDVTGADDEADTDDT